jgi:bidirectional [NiFe] hydrogenase diaphorase subunit
MRHRVSKKRYELPAGDPRTKMLMARIKRERYQPDSLIQILHTAQVLYGHLDKEVIGFITQELKIPRARAYGVVTFYHFFSTKPKGEHTCLVCTGTACYVKGAQGLMDVMKKAYDLDDGDVTPNNRLGLRTARCLGACGLAPVVVVDDEVHPKVQAERLKALIEEKIGV